MVLFKRKKNASGLFYVIVCPLLSSLLVRSLSFFSGIHHIIWRPHRAARVEDVYENLMRYHEGTLYKHIIYLYYRLLVFLKRRAAQLLTFQRRRGSVGGGLDWHCGAVNGGGAADKQPQYIKPPVIQKGDSARILHLYFNII